ncbi:hypothetical protein [Acidaminobacterium chupaoyuni]
MAFSLSPLFAIIRPIYPASARFACFILSNIFSRGNLQSIFFADKISPAVTFFRQSVPMLF